MASSAIRDAWFYHMMLANDEERDYHALLIKVDDKLLLPAFDPDPVHGHSCPNSKVRTDMWLKRPDIDPEEQNVGILSLLGLLCIESKVRDCGNEPCIDKRMAMENTAPTCGWKAFRNWALTTMSCQEAFTYEEKLSRAHTHLANAVCGCVQILEYGKYTPKQFRKFLDGFPKVPVDLVGVCNVIYWMATIQSSLGLGPMGIERWDHHFLPASVTLPDIAEASRKAQQLSICKNQLWNVVNLAERKQSDLPAIVDALLKQPSLCHKKHDFCTASKCQHAHMNTTQIKQMHMCPNSDECKPSVFPMDLLGPVVERGEGTAWFKDGARLGEANEPYIAISHVWSDGTGGRGSVNPCLFKHFANLADTLHHCVAIWWDALSIPLDNETRNKALTEMHNNYANAACTVVHDLYLLGLKWTDPGTACLAIVLSPWFTRGWTALELAVSSEVKVLFKGSDPRNPDIRDLDADILAAGPGTASRTHWLASSMIRRLRKPIHNVSDLLAILRPRSTSWVRDRTIIAALLAGVPECDFSRSESEITRDIIVHLGHVPYVSLLHGQPTMFESGGFSWCPATLDDMPIDACTDLTGDFDASLQERMLHVDSKGVVTGEWSCRLLSRDEVKEGRLQPHGNDLATVVRVHSALIHWKNCLLLKEESNDEGPVLLVATVGLEQDEDDVPIIDCRYVGAVRETRTVSSSDSNMDDALTDSNADANANNGDDAEVKNRRGDERGVNGADIWSSADIFSIRIGNENGRSDVRAIGIIKSAREMEPDLSIDSDVSMEYNSSVSDASEHSEFSDGDTSDGPDAGKYKRADFTERSREQDQYVPETSETKNAHLLLALKGDWISAVRHLIRNGAEIPVNQDPKLEELIGPNAFDKFKMLGDAYLDIDMQDKGEEVYQRAVDHLYRRHGLESASQLETIYEFGRIFLKRGKLDVAAKMYNLVLEGCDEEFLDQDDLRLRAIADLSALYADKD
jgi:hypothetical protein